MMPKETKGDDNQRVEEYQMTSLYQKVDAYIKSLISLMFTISLNQWSCVTNMHQRTIIRYYKLVNNVSITIHVGKRLTLS